MMNIIIDQTETLFRIVSGQDVHATWDTFLEETLPSKISCDSKILWKHTQDAGRNLQTF